MSAYEYIPIHLPKSDVTRKLTIDGIKHYAAWADAPIVVGPSFHELVMACVDWLAANPQKETDHE